MFFMHGSAQSCERPMQIERRRHRLELYMCNARIFQRLKDLIEALAFDVVENCRLIRKIKGFFLRSPRLEALQGK